MPEANCTGSTRRIDSMTLIARPDSQLLVVDANVARLEATRAALAPVGASVLAV